MRELTKEEIHQVSAGPTPPTPVAAIPTIFDAASGSAPAHIRVGPGRPWSHPSLARGERS